MPHSKFIVLRFYKTPPRYGIEMSDVVRHSMQLAIFLHMAFGFYMFSNSQIFTYQSTVKYVEDLKKAVNKGVKFSSIDGATGQYLSSARIFQPHAIFYLVSIILYVVLYLVANVFLTVCGNNACPGFCCCCCSGKGRK